MSTNGILDFQGTNKATFVGENSNVVIDTVNASFGIGVDVNGPTSNLHVVGNAYVTSNLEVGTANLFVDTVNSRVGVGTDAPIEKLDVRGAIIAPVVSYSSNQDAPYLIAGTPGYTGAATSWNTHGFQHRIKSDSGGTPRITVDTPSGGEAFSIVNGGNVGIGTATPRTNLHIGQQLNSQGDKNTIPAAGLGISANFPSSTHAWFAHRSNATGDEYWGLAVGTIYSGSSYLQNLNKNSGIYYNLLLQPNGGNVGIGTTTPTAKLHIKSSSGVDGIAIVNPAGGTGGLLNSSAGVRGGILISNSGGGLDAADNYSSQPIVFSGGGTGATNGNIRGGSIWSIWGGSQYGLAFKGASDGDSVPAGATPPNMFISSDKVGIGTTNPSAQLHISSGNSGDCVLKIEADEDNSYELDNPRIEFITDGGYKTALVGAGQMPFETTNDNALVLAALQTKFYTGIQDFTDSTNMLERMCIDSSGRVGIGTTSPGCILDVAMQHGEISLPMVHFRANRDGASQGDGNILKLENSGNRSDVELLQCVSGSNTEFVVKANGNVGIGFNDPGTLGTHTYGGGRRILHLMGWMYYGDLSGDNETWVTGIGTSTSGNANHYLWRFSLNGAALYNVACIRYDDGTYNDLKTFTGQHRAARIENIPPKDAHTYEGLIVVADKNAYESVNGEKRRGKEAITANEAVPFLTLSKKVRDKRCFGVISASEDPDKREQRFGNFVSIHPKEGGDTFIFVNSLGEGAMWVANVNGALESGDFITTSDVPGYGMKQDDDILHNYTVAKITMDCDFNPPTQPVQRVKKKLGEVKYWVQTKYINVTHEEYDTLDETERTIEYIDSNPIYKKIVKEDSLEEDDDHTELDIRMEMVNDVDENGQMIWEDHPTETEKAYKIRYLDANGVVTDEANAVHKAAFVGCTYHCG